MTIEDPKDIHRLGLSVELLKLPKWVYCAQVCVHVCSTELHKWFWEPEWLTFFWETISQVLWDEVSTFHILVRSCSVEGQQEHKIFEWTNSLSSQVPFMVRCCYAKNIWYLKEGDFKIIHLLPIPLQSKESKSIWKYSLLIYFSSYAKEKSAYFSLYSLISITWHGYLGFPFPWGSLYAGFGDMRTG